MFNRSEIFTRAWEIFRKEDDITFGEALHRAWNSAKVAPVNAERIETAKAAAGIEEECRTWYGWKQEGYEVIHESKALFKCELIYASKGDGVVYKAAFFGRSQVHEIEAA